MSPLVVRRPPAVRRFQILSCAMQALAALLFFRWYRDTGATFDLAMAAVFALWAALMLWSILTRPLRFAETEDEFVLYHAIRTSRIRWDQLTGIADGDTLRRMLFLVYRDDAGKERYAGVTRKGLGEDGLQAILRLISTKKPGLKRFSAGKLQDTPAELSA